MSMFERTKPVLGVRSLKLTAVYFSSKNAGSFPDIQKYQADNSSSDFLSIAVGEASDFIEGITSASWSRALRAPAGQISSGVVQDGAIHLLRTEVFENVTSPHVVSIALTKCPSSNELNVTARLCREFQEQGTFIIITGPDDTSIGLSGLGLTCDCFIGGDCSTEHHSYPARTIADPIEGRMICYELLDVLKLWAGRIGKFNSQPANLDGLHIEISPSVGRLADIDRVATRLRRSVVHDIDELTSVVSIEASEEAYTTIFQRSALISQRRV